MHETTSFLTFLVNCQCGSPRPSIIGVDVPGGPCPSIAGQTDARENASKVEDSSNGHVLWVCVEVPVARGMPSVNEIVNCEVTEDI